MGMSATDSQFHVLAVDDSVIDRKLIERLLKTSSYQVTTVDSGSKALEFLGFYEDDQSSSDSPSVSPNNQQEVGVNLVITDYCMPGMTGYDLLKKIKIKSSSTSHLIARHVAHDLPPQSETKRKQHIFHILLDINILQPFMKPGAYAIFF
ncbi:hypothetical protein C1H46_008566 [Malus baccata]|uniref:Response regulatory domain-containing protein n=1 Tax=Malus baccata TaxID=106549 RepID=A0A540N5Q2_MALBA|nr:hypothetical protein C1H46_008566 [Malus baccata]